MAPEFDDQPLSATVIIVYAGVLVGAIAAGAVLLGILVRVGWELAGRAFS